MRNQTGAGIFREKYRSSTDTIWCPSPSPSYYLWSLESRGSEHHRPYPYTFLSWFLLCTTHKETTSSSSWPAHIGLGHQYLDFTECDGKYTIDRAGWPNSTFFTQTSGLPPWVQVEAFLQKAVLLEIISEVMAGRVEPGSVRCCLEHLFW